MMRQSYRTPGVYREEQFAAPAGELRTGVPAFIGLLRKAEADARPGAISLQPLAQPGLWLARRFDPARGAIWAQPAGAYSRDPDELTLWPQFAERFGPVAGYGWLAHAVRGFFANGGRLCTVALICFDEAVATVTPLQALRAALELLAPRDDVDLVCAPDIMRFGVDAAQPLQAELLAACAVLGDRFAILDAPPGGPDAALRLRSGLSGDNGALYFPWVRTADGPAAGGGFVPPCGHVTGVYARSDRTVGVHKAPANELLEGVLDLQYAVGHAEQGQLNEAGVNCLRSFPGRGLRVWGARTVSRDPAWRYVSVRRIVLTAARWMQRNMAAMVFEANEPRLWARVGRELTAYCTRLYDQGALKGAAPREAFYVKCDAETNPPAARERGEVVAEIGLAPSMPGEFIVVRIIHGPGGVSLSGA